MTCHQNPGPGNKKGDGSYQLTVTRSPERLQIHDNETFGPAKGPYESEENKHSSSFLYVSMIFLVNFL